MTKETPILVAVATPHSVLNKGIAARLREEPEMHVVAATASPRILLRIAERLVPDAVVIDERLSMMTNRDLIAEVHGASEPSGILALLTDGGRAAALHAHESGAIGFATLDVTLDSLINGIRAMACGMGWFPHSLLTDDPEDPPAPGTMTLIEECQPWAAPDQWPSTSFRAIPG